MLSLFDTATGGVRPLALRDEGRVSMYVCGPTVYDLPHLGHGRFTLVFDVLRRYLIFSGLDVTYVSNITDIDDNIIGRATREGRDRGRGRRRVRGALVGGDGRARRAAARPHARTPPPTSRAWSRRSAELLERGVAYSLDDGVYLDTAKVDGYGLLAGQPLELAPGGRARRGRARTSARRSTSPCGRRPSPASPSWEAPFGAGRPGWHTECVVMSLEPARRRLRPPRRWPGPQVPPPRERARPGRGAGRPFAQHWAHNGWVWSRARRCRSRSGNFTSLTDLLERADGRAYRLLVLRSHYRAPIEVTTETIADAERAPRAPRRAGSAARAPPRLGAPWCAGARPSSTRSAVGPLRRR